MGTVLLILVVVLVIAGLVYGVVTLLAGDDPGLSPADPDGRARPLPNNRSLTEFDLKAVRFDVGLRGYRMGQVDRVLRRTAYDIGYKDEMIAVLEAEVIALREGRVEDAELLRKARESAAAPPAVGGAGGAHRATDVTAEAGADQNTDEGRVAHEEPPAANQSADEDELDIATAPGRLNRAALRRVGDEDAELPQADPDPCTAAAAGPRPEAVGPDEAPEVPGTADEADRADPDEAGAEPRART
jgi:DivIVA domain-containing protein